MDLATDVGPVIDADSQAALQAHANELAPRRLHTCSLPASCDAGTFVAPQVFEIGSIGDLHAEHFGPLLHVVRFAAADWGKSIDEIRQAPPLIDQRYWLHELRRRLRGFEVLP